MIAKDKQILILALGNDILGDDGVGIVAARELQEELNGRVEIVESPTAGLALLDILEGYEKVIILDAIFTTKFQAGTLLELGREDFSNSTAPSPHYIGIPEVFSLAEKLEIPFPREIKIFAMEVEDPFQFGETMSESVMRALPNFVKKIKKQVEIWS